MSLVFTVVFLILTTVSTVSAQKLIDGGKPKAAPRTAETESSYIQFPKNLRVYKVRNLSEESTSNYFEIVQNGKSLGKFDVSEDSFRPETNNFQAFWGDLDKNKAAELVIVDFNGQGNGLGVNHYTINILADFEKRGFAAPLSFNTSEFGKDGTFLYDARKNETLILQTEWGGVNIKDAKRGEGLYFTGRFFRYANGKLKPAADRPILARRYLNSFQNERFRTENDPRRPYLWLDSPAALKLSADPVFDEKPSNIYTGTIEKIETIRQPHEKPNGESQTVEIQQITVRLDSGENKTIVLSKNSAVSQLESRESKIIPENFGFLPAKFTLPRDFSPTLVLENFQGRKVQLNVYQQSQDSQPNYSVWFIEK